MISEDGFNGIVDIGWDAESQRWMMYKLRDGKRLFDMRDKLKQIVKKETFRVVL